MVGRPKPHRLKSIYDGNEFMNEAHVHGFANRLKRTIMIIDVRFKYLAIYEFKPGYATVRDAEAGLDAQGQGSARERSSPCGSSYSKPRPLECTHARAPSERERERAGRVAPLALGAGWTERD